MNKFSYILFVLGFVIFGSGCSKMPEYIVENFNPATNYFEGQDTVLLDVEIPDNIFEGIRIPFNGYFKINFDIRNNSGRDQRFYYKIFYKNESYCYPVNIGEGDTLVYNPLASENFYGSWKDVNDSFHSSGIIPSDGELYPVVDSFCIIGNPRDESIYFGKDEDETYPDQSKIEATIKMIENTPDWFKSIEEKAGVNKRSAEEQVFLDALWVIRNDRDNGTINNRWKRNPRAGIYSFKILIVNEDQMASIPGYIQNIGVKAGDTLYQDPDFFFAYDPINKTKDYTLIESEVCIKAKIKFDFSSGIYLDPLKFTSPSVDFKNVNSSCNVTEDLYKKAQIQQFFHNIDKNFVMDNVPLVKNLDEFTKEEYDKYTGYTEEEMVKDYIRISEEPCKTVAYSESDHAVVLKNPASSASNRRKENVGIQSRVGFTYGKITAKIKFPQMLNKENVWNGITNAFWLIYHEESGWNYRRPCEKLGYIPKSEIGKTDVRVPSTFYTEIDIEIVKASKHWPPTSYYNDVTYPGENDPDQEDDIIVTCTNWDLACNEPDSFNVGVFSVKHLDKKYYPHRWDHWYKALTMKYAVNHSNMFDRDYYFYQIDWQPDCIIWRIGPEKDQMFEVGYLDATVSNIPNNQMTFIVTQEYHHSEWWPTTPFKQEYIPYLSNEIIGKVYEVVIE
ncbi:MAG: hypothetical protein K9H58_12825 [Bacteroidales bacterium]|nr:hypothetical protein [Bacteroidales bacterium]